MQKEMFEGVSDSETSPNDHDTRDVPINSDASQSIKVVLSDVMAANI